MRIVHLADLHLGYRQYQRLTPGGLNQREADVARSFERAIDAVIELSPQVVLFAGDVFHTVRPANPAILHAFIHFARLMKALPDAVVIMVAGNHDTPRAAETGCLLQLFSRLGIEVVDREARRLSYPEHDLSVLAVPDVYGADEISFVPDPDFSRNVLVMHGGITGMLPAFSAEIDRPSIEVSPAELNAHRWTYVALGHCHVYREVAPNAFYAGSIDYTSVNTWGELREQKETRVRGKGFIERDLDSGVQEFHLLPPSRDLLDLPVVSARGMTVAEVDGAIRQAVEKVRGGIDDKVVRLRVVDLPRHVARELDHRSIREFKRRALHFHLDLRRPETARLSSAGGAPRRRLHELVREHLLHRTIDREMDRGELIRLGLEYLDEAESAPGAAAPAD